MQIEIIASQFDDSGREVKVTLKGVPALPDVANPILAQALILLKMQIEDPK